MLVVHPKDITTSVLTSLYKGTDSKVIDQTASKREIEHMLHHCSPRERIMLLGHGSKNGLFSPMPSQTMYRFGKFPTQISEEKQ